MRKLVLPVALSLGGIGVGWSLPRNVSPLPTLALTAPAQIEATLFLPLVDNHDQPFSRERMDEALRTLLDVSGGLTLGQKQEGCWVNAQGEVRREASQQVIISVPAQKLPALRAAIQRMSKVLDQDCIYVRYAEPRIELLSPKSAGDN